MAQVTIDADMENSNVYSKKGLFSRRVKKSSSSNSIIDKKIIAVYSPTSEGASTLATHIGYTLADAGHSVIIMDFNPLKPSIRKTFRVSSEERTMADLLDILVKEKISNKQFKDNIIKSRSNKNLDLLLGLYDLNKVYNSKNRRDYQFLIEIAHNLYDYVIIDTHSWYDLFTTDRALYMAHDILVPVRGNKASLDTVKRYLDNFKRFNDFNIHKFALVINMYDAKDLTSIEIEGYMDYRLLGYVRKDDRYQYDYLIKSNKKVNEYIDILSNLGIENKKKKRPLKAMFNKTRKKKGEHDCL